MEATQPFATVRVRGPEAISFVQSLTCNDVVALPVGSSAWNGLCSPKGRLLALFWVAKVSDDELTLTIDPESAEFLLTQLTRYRFRRKVDLALGEPVAGPDWATFVANGWPWILPANREVFLPQWVNLDLLGGVSFTKGCYPGQEVVARTRYLGEVKRRMVPVSGLGAPPAAGTPCYTATDNGANGPDGSAEVGRVVLAAPAGDGFAALVSVRLSALEGALTIGHPAAAPVTRLPLPYRLEAQ